MDIGKDGWRNEDGEMRWSGTGVGRKGGGMNNQYCRLISIQSSILLCEREKRVKWKENSHFPTRRVFAVCYEMLKINLLISNEPRHSPSRVFVFGWGSMLWPLSSQCSNEASLNWDTILNLFTFVTLPFRQSYVMIYIEIQHNSNAKL